jgi:hypothetical protein
MAPTPSRSAKEVGPTGPTLAWFGLGFKPRHPLVSYYLWLCLILDILKICIDFGPYDTFLSSDVPEKLDQQNSWNLLVIRIYLLYRAWNVGLLAVNICILWPPTPTDYGTPPPTAAFTPLSSTQHLGEPPPPWTCLLPPPNIPGCHREDGTTTIVPVASVPPHHPACVRQPSRFGYWA